MIEAFKKRARDLFGDAGEETGLSRSETVGGIDVSIIVPPLGDIYKYASLI